MTKIINLAIELGYCASAEEFYAKPVRNQDILIMRLGKMLSRRRGQGWSR